MLHTNAYQSFRRVVGRLTRSTFAKNVASTFTVQVLVLILNIIQAAVIARWLGPEGKGVVALALLIPGMLGLFLNGGLGVANVYFAGSKQIDPCTLTVNSIALVIPATALGILAMVILVFTGWLEKLVPGVPLWLVILGMVSLPLSLLIGFLNGLLQGLQRIVMLNILNIIQSMLNLVLTSILLIGLRFGAAGALLAFLGSTLINLVLLSVVLRREGCVFRPRWDRTVMQQTLSFGMKGYIGNILQFFNYRLDMILVNYFLNPASVGIYTVSARFAELLWNLPNAVGFVIFPKAAATKPETLNQFTPRIFATVLVITMLGAVGLAILGRPLITLVYSAAFLDAYIPMLALLPGIVLLGAAKVLTNEIAGRGYPHYNSITSGIALVLTIVLDLGLIPRYGVLGASIASSIAYSVIWVISIFFYWIVSRKTRSTGVR